VYNICIAGDIANKYCVQTKRIIHTRTSCYVMLRHDPPQYESRSCRLHLAKFTVFFLYFPHTHVYQWKKSDVSNASESVKAAKIQKNSSLNGHIWAVQKSIRHIAFFRFVECNVAYTTKIRVYHLERKPATVTYYGTKKLNQKQVHPCNRLSQPPPWHSIQGHPGC
jgi:hypothetical protein